MSNKSFNGIKLSHTLSWYARHPHLLGLPHLAQGEILTRIELINILRQKHSTKEKTQ